VSIRNKGFLPHLNKKLNVEIDSAASSEDQGKYRYVSVPWPQLEAAMSIFNIRLCFKNDFLKKELIKQIRLPYIPYHMMYKMSVLRKSVR